MNKTISNFLERQKQQEELFAAQGATKIFGDVSAQAQRKATMLLSEGSVHLTYGLYLTKEDINKKRQRAEALRLDNERYPLSTPPKASATEPELAQRA
jgi:hypothetical protein